MKKTIKLSLFILASLLILNTYGQGDDYWIRPCKCDPNLTSLFNGDVLDILFLSGMYNSRMLGNLSSSMLMPGGTPPEIKEDPDGGPPDNVAYVEWTCKYSLGKLSDGDTTTAWAEGEDGSGIGVVLIWPHQINNGKPLKIWAGYGKSNATFITNNRPKKVRVVVISAETHDFSQNDEWYRTLKVVKDSVVILKDLNGFQNLFLPTFKEESYFSQDRKEDVPYNYLLGLEILEVYPGTKYDDTCITEISGVEDK